MGHGGGDSSDDEENEWWRNGLIQPPRAVVKWDHTDESRPSKGIAEKGRKVSWSELFMDLIMVTSIALLGEAYQGGDLTLLEGLVLYRLIYMAWWATTYFCSMWYVDDIVDKYVIGLLMFLLICAGLRFGEYPFPVAASVCARAVGVYYVVQASSWARAVRAFEGNPNFLVLNGLAPCLVKGGLLLAASFEPSVLVLALIVALDPLWNLVSYTVLRYPKKDRVPIHLDHLVERRGCLRLILFGEVVTGVTAGASGSILASLPSVLAGFLIVFNMKLMAFDTNVVPLKRHAFRAGRPVRVIAFIEAAFLFDSCMGIMGSCIRMILLGHLAELSRAPYAHELLCLVVGGGVLFLMIERLMHDHADLFEEPPGGYQATCDRTRAESHVAKVRRRHFRVQLGTHAAVVAVCVGLGIYCRAVESEAEATLVIACLAALTTVAVWVDLLDEIEVVQSCEALRLAEGAGAAA